MITKFYKVSKISILILCTIVIEQAWSYRAEENSKPVKMATSLEDCKPPMNISQAHKLVADYYDSGCVALETSKIIKKAIKHFKDHPCQECEKCVVIFDIDQTVLDGYQYFKSIQFGFIPEITQQWEKHGNFPAIKQTKKLYDYLIKNNFRIIFISGRKFDEYNVTKKNLMRCGFCKFDKIILRSKNDKRPAAIFKCNTRQEVVDLGYKVVGSVGDQESDHAGDNIGYKVKLPNYMFIIN